MNLAPPRPAQIFNEAFTWLELPRMMINSPALLNLPRGNGGKVMVFPGFGAGDFSTTAIRGFLSYLGHDVSGWQQGLNTADVPYLIEALSEKVERAYQQDGREIALVGWSLGGYLAREVARDLPHAVAQVVTLGSPVVGGPKYTQVAAVYRQQGIDVDWIEAEVAAREQVPLRVPVTAVYSKLDGVVAWEACIDRQSGMTEHVEVNTTHFGLGFSADVFRIMAERLARHR